MSRPGFLILHNANPQKWADKHGLTPFTHPCKTCGTPLTTTLPLVTKSWRGLISPDCTCGDSNPPYCIML